LKDEIGVASSEEEEGLSFAVVDRRPLRKCVAVTRLEDKQR
jgi:hypothetical protein